MSNKVTAEEGKILIELNNGKVSGDVKSVDDVNIVEGDDPTGIEDKKERKESRFSDTIKQLRNSVLRIEDSTDTKEEAPPVSYLTLFRYAGCGDWFLMLLGVLASMANGAGFPVLFILFGDLTTEFTEYGKYDRCNHDYNECTAANYTDLDEVSFNAQVAVQRVNFKSVAIDLVYYMAYVGCAAFVLSSIQVATFSLSSVRQVKKIRYQYFRAILRQDIGFHDQSSSGELNVRLSSDLNKVKDGMGEKIGSTIQNISMGVSGFIVAFVHSWKLSMVLLVTIPLISLTGGLFFYLQTAFTQKELNAYTTAGAIAEESISSIRTVTAFGGQKHCIKRYNNNLSEAKKVGIRKGVIIGANMGLQYVTSYAGYCIAFWYGTILALDGEITPGNMYTAFFGMVLGGFGLGMVGNFASNLVEGKTAAAKIFMVIDRVPTIDIMSDLGKSPDYANDVAIELTDVDFTYPSRLDYKVLKKVSLKVKHGQQVALVGQSGSGKSTIVQLIQRFYDVQSGAVIVGGRDVRELNVRRLRETIGVVAQEPVLFNTTVRDNICWGNDDVTDDEIYAAAREANAYDFIMKMPQKFDTCVGEGGGKMSGGQKQRIAIARAILRKPNILLLDEATSALDTESESIVQSALDRASAGRTTIVIAHRLSTVRNADKIIVFDGGQVIEQGTHDELVRLNGVYANLAHAQDAPSMTMSKTKLEQSPNDPVPEALAVLDSVPEQVEQSYNNSENDHSATGAENSQNVDPTDSKSEHSLWLENQSAPYPTDSKSEHSLLLENPSAPATNSTSKHSVLLENQSAPEPTNSTSEHSVLLENPSAPDPSAASGNFKDVTTDRNTVKPTGIDLKSEVTGKAGNGDKQEGTEENEGDDKDDEEDLAVVSLKRLFVMNKPEWGYMAAGTIFAAIAGSPDPLSAILFAEVLNIFLLTDRQEQNDTAALYGILFLVIGFAALVGWTVEAALFSKAGMELTARMRKRAFSSILRQDIAYFDKPRHNTGVLCARLATDASLVQSMTGWKVGLVVKSLSTLGLAFGIAFAYSWQLTLVMLLLLPLLATGSFIEMELLMADESKAIAEYEAPSKIAGEAIHNIRTIASFTQEQSTLRSYIKALEGPVRKGIRKCAIMGLAYGYSQCIFFFCYAVIFRYGIDLVIWRAVLFADVFKVQTALMFGAMGVAQGMSMAPDFATAQLAASRMVALFDRVPDIDSESQDGRSPKHCKGQIDISSVVFRYPTRSEVTVLKRCTISVKPGKTVALVGQSGCGKSTSVQLIQRFYDPEEGKILLDGTDIRSLNISWLRQQMGLVSQEPVLLNLSIKENIMFGDCSRTPTKDEVIAAAKMANAHAFISSFPHGYDTLVGASGSQLSGGQKQRIAIARALIRNPKLLLLDEATSALDNESEKIVQAALDTAQTGRTCIVIAHRLSTVKNADLIVVIGNGEVVESGTHDELTARQGAYFSLVNAQLSAEEQKMQNS